MKHFLIATVSLLTLVACAPQVEKREFEGAKTEFKPNFEDVDLRALYKLNSDFSGVAEFSGGYSHGSLYRFSENLFLLGKSLDRPQLMSLGVTTRKKIQQASQDSQVHSDKSPYIDFLISKSRSSVGEALDNVDQDLLDGQNEIVNIIANINAKFSPDAPAVDIASGIEYVKQYLRELIQKINKTTVMPELKTALATELNKKITEIDSLNAKIQPIVSEGNTFPEMLRGVFDFLAEQKIELPADFSPMIEQAKVVAAGLENCQTPQDGLTVIVDVWQLLDEKDRKTYFQEISPALYKELSKSSLKALACLRDDNCKNFFRSIKKSLFILPEIKKFGVEKICHEIDVNAKIFVNNLLQTEIAKILVKAPDAIPDQIKIEITKKRDDLKFVKKNFAIYFRDRFMNWANEHQLTSIMLNPKGRKTVGLSGRQISFSDADAGDLDLFEALGPASAASAQQTDLKSAFEMISRMASVSDIIMNDDNVRGKPITNDFRNANQAEILRGLSQVIRFLRDWEKTNFEQTLGMITAQDLLPEVDLGQNNQSLFPKADLYALSISTTAQFIQNLQSKMSPIFTMDLQQKISWQNKIEETDTLSQDLKPGSDAKQPEVLAGIVEINKGQRSNLVKTAHLSRWIIAISEFMAAIEGVEKSASTDLRIAGADGKIPLETLQESKKTLQQLILGLANFLSYQMTDERGLFAASFDIQTLKRSSTNEISVLDQALAIRALLIASDILKMETYRFAAIDGYYKMNTHLFHVKQRFYQNSKAEQNTQLPVIAEMLRTLLAIEPHLPTKSAEQLRWIMDPWLKVVENLKY